MSAFSVRQAGRLAASSLAFFVWSAGCATGTHPGDADSDGDVGGTGGNGGTELGGSGGVATAGDSSHPSAGMPAAGTTTAGGVGGGGSGAGAGAGAGGIGGHAGAGGAGGRAGAGGVGGNAGGAGAGGGGAGGMAGHAGTAGMAGMAGAGGAPPTGFRYAKLVATSEQSGAVWSSVAELQILTTGNLPISRTGWTVTADSEETDDEQDPATNAIDGDNATFWHTAWEPAPADVNDPKLPHSLIVDMKSAHPVTGFTYLPRQVGKNGHIKNYEFYVSKDGTTWGTAVKMGAFPDVITLQTVMF